MVLAMIQCTLIRRFQGAFFNAKRGRWGKAMLHHLLTTNELKVEEIYQILEDARKFCGWNEMETGTANVYRKPIF